MDFTGGADKRATYPNNVAVPLLVLQEEVLVLEEQQLTDFDIIFPATAVNKKARAGRIKVTADLQVS